MTTDNSTKPAPAYARFVAALSAQFAALDIPVTPIADPSAKDGLHGNEGWVLFQVIGTGDKVYAKRTRNGDPSVIETTVPYDLIPDSLIVKDMRDLNGKIEARVLPDVAALASGLLPVLASRLKEGASLRASKAPVRRELAQKVATVAETLRAASGTDSEALPEVTAGVGA